MTTSTSVAHLLRSSCMQSFSPLPCKNLSFRREEIKCFPAKESYERKYRGIAFGRSSFTQSCCSILPKKEERRISSRRNVSISDEVKTESLENKSYSSDTSGSAVCEDTSQNNSVSSETEAERTETQILQSEPNFHGWSEEIMLDIPFFNWKSVTKILAVLMLTTGIAIASRRLHTTETLQKLKAPKKLVSFFPQLLDPLPEKAGKTVETESEEAEEAELNFACEESQKAGNPNLGTELDNWTIVSKEEGNGSMDRQEAEAKEEKGAEEEEGGAEASQPEKGGMEKEEGGADMAEEAEPEEVEGERGTESESEPKSEEVVEAEFLEAVRRQTEMDKRQTEIMVALQSLMVIELQVNPTEVCTRREFARWLVAANHVLESDPGTRIYPAMFINGFTDLGFDDILPSDPDFSTIQGLAEAGIIPSQLSMRDSLEETDERAPISREFHPNRPLTRQDLIQWTVAAENRSLQPEVDPRTLTEEYGILDARHLSADVASAVLQDLTAGPESGGGVIFSAFGYTKRLRPNDVVTHQQAAASLATGQRRSELLSNTWSRLSASWRSEAETARLEEASRKRRERAEALEGSRKALEAMVAARVEAEQEREAAGAELREGRFALESEAFLVEKQKKVAREVLEALVLERRELEEKLDSEHQKVKIAGQAIRRVRFECWHLEKQMQDQKKSAESLAEEKSKTMQLRGEAEQVGCGMEEQVKRLKWKQKEVQLRLSTVLADKDEAELRFIKVVQALKKLVFKMEDLVEVMGIEAKIESVQKYVFDKRLVVKEKILALAKK